MFHLKFEAVRLLVFVLYDKVLIKALTFSKTEREEQWRRGRERRKERKSVLLRRSRQSRRTRRAQPCGAGFHHVVISSERSEDFIAERFHANWGRSKFCKTQIGDGAMPCVFRLQRPAHGPKFARISECLLLSPSVTSCHLPPRWRLFYGVSGTPHPTLRFALSLEL